MCERFLLCPLLNACLPDMPISGNHKFILPLGKLFFFVHISQVSEIIWYLLSVWNVEFSNHWQSMLCRLDNYSILKQNTVSCGLPIPK
jgi:hypothetical protein